MVAKLPIQSNLLGYPTLGAASGSREFCGTLSAMQATCYSTRLATLRNAERAGSGGGDLRQPITRLLSGVGPCNG